MNNSFRYPANGRGMIDIEEIRREYGVETKKNLKTIKKSSGDKLVSARLWMGSRLRNTFHWFGPLLDHHETDLGLIRQEGIGKRRRNATQKSPWRLAGSWLDLFGLNFLRLGNSRRETVKKSPRRPAATGSDLLGFDLGNMGKSRRKTVQNSPSYQAGILSWLMESTQRGVGNRQRIALQKQPSRTLLPRFLVLPWWMVFIVLGGTAVVSVSYSEGEEHQVTEKNAQENQSVEEMSSHEEVSEEASLVKQLQDRLKELEEREQRLQQKEARIEGLQRDVEALAERQAKEAERLNKRAAELDEKNNQQAKEDPSLAHLVKVYNAMDPEEAALRIEKMDERLALEILSGIKDKKAAVVLAGVNPKKAAALSQGLRNFQMAAKKQ